MSYNFSRHLKQLVVLYFTQQHILLETRKMYQVGLVIVFEQDAKKSYIFYSKFKNIWIPCRVLKIDIDVHLIEYLDRRDA